MYVAASTDCYARLSLEGALSKLADMEYGRVEVAVREAGDQLKPSQVAADPEGAVRRCRDLHRLTPVAYFVDIQAKGPTYFEQFTACTKLAKATKAVVITVRAGELGHPFNAEIERLRELVRIAGLEGIVVGLKTEIGRLTQDPNTALALCKTVKGLGLTLDPSHYVTGPFAGVDYSNLLPLVCHVHLRDSKKDALQVKVGQGEIDYGRLITHLSRFGYNRGLTVDIAEVPGSDVDHDTELRKLRLLLETMV